MSSKDAILSRLRAARKPFTDLEPIEERRHMSLLEDSSPAALKARFTAEAEKIGVYVYAVADGAGAIQQIRELIGEAKQILAWQAEHLPVKGLLEALQQQGVEVAAHDDRYAEIGISGADVGLAATGSLIVYSGAGKYRTTSLLPDKHIALLDASRIVADLETWAQQQVQNSSAAFRLPSNTVIITGPSKTADIAQELIKGAHGPRQVHVIIIG
jgi:L-lactate dehydrogenase complex protein LldG